MLEYKLLFSAIKLNARPNSNIYISAIPPRLDKRVKAIKSLNYHLSSLADLEANIFFVCHDDAFFTTAGVSIGLLSYLAGDKYHLNKKGTEVLLSFLNELLGFKKATQGISYPPPEPPSSWFTPDSQTLLQLWGNTSPEDRCWYGRKLQCRICHIYGHKASMCFQRHQSNKQEIPVLESLDDFSPPPVRIGVEQFTTTTEFPEKKNRFLTTSRRVMENISKPPCLMPDYATQHPSCSVKSPASPNCSNYDPCSTPCDSCVFNGPWTIRANSYKFGTRHAPQWSNTATVYSMVNELLFHASSYQFGACIAMV